MAGVSLWLVITTVAVYLAFAIGFGEEVFQPPESDSCNDAISCASAMFDFFEGIFQFLTLGGFSGLLPVIVQVPLLILLAAGWGMALADVVLP